MPRFAQLGYRIMTTLLPLLLIVLTYIILYPMVCLFRISLLVLLYLHDWLIWLAVVMLISYLLYPFIP